MTAPARRCRTWPAPACTAPARPSTIDEARGAGTDAVIGEIVLADFVIGGEPQSAAQQVSDSSSNVQVDGDSLRCTLPCALGSAAGDWQFTASAPGYQDTPQQFAVSYTFIGGCPSRDQGSVVDVFLDEEGFG